jgi:hypothetical protein
VPEYVLQEDIQKFDVVLINAPEDLHAMMPSLAPLTPITIDGRWRLYQVQKSGRKGFVITF